MKTKFLFLLSMMMIGLTLSISAQKKKHYNKHHKKQYYHKTVKHRYAPLPAPRVVVLPAPPGPAILLPPLPPRPRIRH